MQIDNITQSLKTFATKIIILSLKLCQSVKRRIYYYVLIDVVNLIGLHDFMHSAQLVYGQFSHHTYMYIMRRSTWPTVMVTALYTRTKTFKPVFWCSYIHSPYCLILQPNLPQCLSCCLTCFGWS